jgi:hypothetical protein
VSLGFGFLLLTFGLMMDAPDCLFCRIAKRLIPADIVGEADGLLARPCCSPAGWPNSTSW